MTTYHVVYHSRALVAPRSADAAAVYLAARPKNRALGITGYLNRHGDQFLQYIEGPRDSLGNVMKAIARDWRHADMTVLYRGQGPRLFGDWDMAFSDDELLSFHAFLANMRSDRIDANLYRQYFAYISSRLAAEVVPA